MKCIRCNRDCKYKERPTGQCPHCRGQFAFEPKSGDPFSDSAFKGCIDRVSANGQVRWGAEHLYYELCRRKLPRGIKSVLGTIVISAIAIVLVAGVFEAVSEDLWLLGVFVCAAIVGVILYYSNRATVRVSAELFKKLYARWTTVHGPPEGVIIRQPAPVSKRQLESDVADYSFDRAVICDRARTVDLLLANNFHFENNCAVLSVEGYPERAFATVLSMLKRNARLEVYALHDATEEGCRLASKLASEPKWFLGQGTVIDVGLRPGHAKPFKGLYLAKNVKVLPGREITEKEAQWLSRYVLELAAIRPEQVLKRLYRAISKKIDAEKTSDGTSGSDDGSGGGDSGSSDSGYKEDKDSFSVEASDSDGGADSFG